MIMNPFTPGGNPGESRARAEAEITVKSSEAGPYDQTVSPTLMEVRLYETFTGDIDGESTVRALQVVGDDQSACLASIQRFRGKLKRWPHKEAAAPGNDSLLARTSELIREIRSQRRPAPLKDADEISARLWACLHGIVSVQINKPTLKWGKPKDLSVHMVGALVL